MLQDAGSTPAASTKEKHERLSKQTEIQKKAKEERGEKKEDDGKKKVHTGRKASAKAY